MPQEKAQGGGFWEKRRKEICGALAVLFLAALGGAFFFFRAEPPPAAPAKQEEGGIGVVDVARAEKAHEAYVQLADLEAQYASLAADIDQLSRARRALKPPALADEPFQIATEQKNLQQQRLAAEAQARERRKALAAWEENTKDAFLKEKKALEDAYQNRIVNIEMKIDNREAMFLSETDVKSLLDELKALREERGERIRALFAARDEEKRKYLDALIARDAKSAKSTAASTQEEAARQKAEAERRNSEALLQAMQGVEIDEILAARVRVWFDLPRSPRLRIRVGDAAEVVGGLRPGQWDVIVRDVFNGGSVPATCRNRAFLSSCLEALVPGGLLLVNTSSTPRTQAGAEIEALTQALEGDASGLAIVADPATMRGRRRGNLVLVARREPFAAVELEEIERAVRRLPLPVRTWSPGDAAVPHPEGGSSR